MGGRGPAPAARRRAAHRAADLPGGGPGGPGGPRAAASLWAVPGAAPALEHRAGLGRPVRGRRPRAVALCRCGCRRRWQRAPCWARWSPCSCPGLAATSAAGLHGVPRRPVWTACARAPGGQRAGCKPISHCATSQAAGRAGLLGSALATTWGALLLMVFSASAAVAVGMPVLLLPAPMLAASGLALFQVRPHCTGPGAGPTSLPPAQVEAAGRSEGLPCHDMPKPCMRAGVAHAAGLRAVFRGGGGVGRLVHCAPPLAPAHPAGRVVPPAPVRRAHPGPVPGPAAAGPGCLRGTQRAHCARGHCPGDSPHPGGARPAALHQAACARASMHGPPAVLPATRHLLGTGQADQQQAWLRGPKPSPAHG